MKIESYKRLYLRPVGIVLGDGRVVGEWGITPISESPKGAVLYARSHDEVFELIRAGRGKAKYWRKRYVSYVIDGKEVKNVRDILSHSEPLEALEELRQWRDWTWDNGANVSSLAGTAHSLWRGTLRDGQRLIVAAGRLPVPTERLFLGGRQEAQRGVHDAGTLWDISGAYPSAMGELRTASLYRRIPFHRVIRSESDLGYVGFAHARVAIKKSYWGPLPHREGKRVTFPIGAQMVEGVYDFNELAVAYKIGLSIYIEEAWVGRGVRFPWKTWYNTVTEGRKLPGVGGRLTKAASNSLWGSFAISGSGMWISYVDGRMVREPTREPFKRKNSEVLSAHISSYIRARLFMEALYFNREGVLAAHTDGCIFAPNAHPVVIEERPGLGNWSERKRMHDLVVIGPASYSYINGTGERRFSLPGCPPQYRERVFKQLLHRDEKKASKVVKRVPFGS